MEGLDVLVVGGGVVGAGIVRDLALRGISCGLVERRDFSAGTTGTCSGMIHGGLRYLEFDVATTKSSCADAGYIRRMAPHLTFRIPFLVPVYPGAKYGIEIMETVMEAYGLYSPLKEGKPSSRLTEAETMRLEPGLEPGMKGAVTLDEWGIDPFRLTLANVLDAARNGARILNHAELRSLRIERGRVVEARIRHHSATEEIPCKAVVNAAGPWSPKVAALAGASVPLRPGKGTHVIFSGRLSNYGVIAPAIDGRELLLLPHEGCTLLGTTDDDYQGDPDDAEATREEIDYLVQGAKRILPGIQDHRIMRVMTGVRPTLFEWGPIEDKLPREHALIDHKDEGAKGFFTMTGGKLATFRIMAEETTDALLRYLGRNAPCRTHLLPLPGGKPTPPPTDFAREHDLDKVTAARLLRRYGSKAAAVLEAGPRAREQVCICEGTLACEIRHAVRNEMAETLADVGRRTRLGYGPCQGGRCSYRAAAIVVEELGLPKESIDRLTVDYLENRFKGQRPFLEGEQLRQYEINMRSLELTGYRNTPDLLLERP